MVNLLIKYLLIWAELKRLLVSLMFLKRHE